MHKIRSKFCNCNIWLVCISLSFFNNFLFKKIIYWWIIFNNSCRYKCHVIALCADGKHVVNIARLKELDNVIVEEVTSPIKHLVQKDICLIIPRGKYLFINNWIFVNPKHEDKTYVYDKRHFSSNNHTYVSRCKKKKKKWKETLCL